MTQNMKTKLCITCGKEFLRPKDYANQQWENRKHCSLGCYYSVPRSKEVREKIGLGCQKSGVGKWMSGKKQSEETKAKKREKQQLRVAKGIHNFYIDGRAKPNCLDCGKSIVRPAKKCTVCCVKRKENHPNWKGGITEPNHALRNSLESKKWREAVFKRDNFKCKINNENCVHEIHAHHILRFADYPELRFDVNNGITLCEEHHPMKKVEEIQLAPIFKSLIAKANLDLANYHSSP